MSAFFLFENKDLIDAEKLTSYVSQVGNVVSRYGGQYRVLGGEPAAFEGSWSPAYLVLIEFPSRAQAEAWYSSSDYQPLKALRQAALHCNGVLMSGVDGPP
jgi:uncharacterized protein (DUF1330 family)